ncbi:GlsB/YeaQ/YmgE family stress response membrane protein [Bradyrhizobium erythrophlei]
MRTQNMNISGETLLVILVVGIAAGWLAGQIVQGTGLGLVGDLVVGIAGAFIASWIFPQLGIHLGSGIVSEIVAAAIGAVLLLMLIRLLQGRSRWGGSWGGAGRRRWW